jgi:hypothetical protein
MKTKKAFFAFPFISAFMLLLTIQAGAQVQAYEADQIANMVGCNTHFNYPGVYTDSFPTLKSRIHELGVRHLRDENNGNISGFNNRINQIAGMGIKFDLICEVWWTWEQNRNYLITTKNMPNSPVEFIEYPNELDVARPESQIQDYTDFYNTYKGDAATSGIPVFGPSFANSAAGAQNFINNGGTDMSDKMDYANLHSYPGGEYVEGPYGGGWGQSLDATINEYQLINSGNKTLVASETGYQLPQPDHGNLPVAESVAAKYEPRLLMWYFEKGIKYAYHYQLVNNNTDENFGLLNPDLSRRKSFDALRNTIKLFSDPGPTFKPDSLNYSLSGQTANIKSLVFQKRNGKFYLVLWQAISSGTASNSAKKPPYDYYNPTVGVKVTISGIKGTAVAYTPSVDSSFVASFQSINTMKLKIPDHLYVIEITPDITSGISRNSSENNLNVFPNPTANIFTIESKSMIQEFTLFNLSGEKVYTEKGIGSNKFDINVSSFPAGSYFLKFISDAGSITRKLNISK